MNYMSIILGEREIPKNNKKLSTTIENLKQVIKKAKVKISKTFTKLGDTLYYDNCLPHVPASRDVLKKPDGVCPIRVNWKKKNFEGMSTDEICNCLKQQYGWCVAVVDEDHTRNKFKNKTIAWVVFDTEEEAKRNMILFNKLFFTAIEKDTVEEYKKFKQNPEKRILSFDKLVPNAYELYDKIDKGEL